jgi:hypothetical protein
MESRDVVCPFPPAASIVEITNGESVGEIEGSYSAKLVDAAADPNYVERAMRAPPSTPSWR